MTKGPRRLVLDQYLDSSAPGVVKNAGRDWKEKADDLQELGEALKQAAAQAELRIGEQTLTGPALRAGMEESSASMLAKSEQLRAAGEALRQVGQHISDTRDTRDAFTDLGEKPSPYQPPAGTPGVELTAEEIQAQADASAARSGERSAWQTQYDKQEARALTLTKEMDAAFLGAIPPMKNIHGQQDPTEPPPHVPSGPGGTYLPGTHAPPSGGSGGGGGGDQDGAGLHEGRVVGVDEEERRDQEKEKDRDRDRDQQQRPTPPTTVITTPPPPIETPTTHVGTEGPTSTVAGSSQNGVSYQAPGSQVSASSGVGGTSAGVSSAALGAAGAAGAGGMAAGAIRPGAPGAASAGSSAPVRAIGSTGRAGSAGALSRAAGAAGSPASRSAGAGSAAGRAAGSAGSPASRGAGAGSTAARAGAGGAGGRGTGSGAGSGSRSGGRGSSGARSAGAGAGAGRGGRKGEREQTADRDRLVYDQDWLGDDDVAPGVLD